MCMGLTPFLDYETAVQVFRFSQLSGLARLTTGSPDNKSHGVSTPTGCYMDYNPGSCQGSLGKAG